MNASKSKVFWDIKLKINTVKSMYYPQWKTGPYSKSKQKSTSHLLFQSSSRRHNSQSVTVNERTISLFPVQIFLYLHKNFYNTVSFRLMAYHRYSKVQLSKWKKVYCIIISRIKENIKMKNFLNYIHNAISTYIAIWPSRIAKNQSLQTVK